MTKTSPARALAALFALWSTFALACSPAVQQMVPQATPTPGVDRDRPPASGPTTTPVPIVVHPATPTVGPVSEPRPAPRIVIAPERLLEIDAHALNAPGPVEGSVRGLATYLSSPTRNDAEKARAIYRWITENVSYDAKAFFSKVYGDQSAEGVLRTRRAVCGGYSALFEALGKAAGLEVVTIEGWAKGYGYDVKELDGKENHAWNAVRIDGGWYLVDSTWGAGHLSKAREFVKEFHPYYWLTPPAQFVSNHLPTDNRWQLLSPPVSKAEYATVPLLGPEYFEYGLQLPAGTGAMARVASRTTLAIGAPLDVALAVAIEQDERRLDDMWATVERKGAQFEVQAVFPGPGKYDLVVFAKKQGDPGPYQGAVTLTYEVSSGEPAFAGFPDLRPEYFQYGLQLPAGTGAITRVASQTTLAVGAPPDVLLLAALEQDGRRLDDKWTFVQRKGAQSQVQAVFPGPGKYDLLVFAKRKAEAGAYKGAITLTFEVSAGEPAFAGFPKAFSTFAELDAYVYTPLQSGLAVGSTHVFKLTVPKALGVTVVMGDVWAKLPRQGETYEGPVTIAKLPAEVCAQFVPGDKYDCLLEYN